MQPLISFFAGLLSYLAGLAFGLGLILGVRAWILKRAQARRQAQARALARLAYLDLGPGPGASAGGHVLDVPRARRAPFEPFTGSGPRKPWQR